MQLWYLEADWRTMRPCGMVTLDKVLLTATVILFVDWADKYSVLSSARNGRWPPLCSKTLMPFTHYNHIFIKLMNCPLLQKLSPVIQVHTVCVFHWKIMYTNHTLQLLQPNYSPQLHDNSHPQIVTRYVGWKTNL